MLEEDDDDELSRTDVEVVPGSVAVLAEELEEVLEDETLVEAADDALEVRREEVEDERLAVTREVDDDVESCSEVTERNDVLDDVDEMIADADADQDEDAILPLTTKTFILQLAPHDWLWSPPHLAEHSLSGTRRLSDFALSSLAQ